MPLTRPSTTARSVSPDSHEPNIVTQLAPFTKPSTTRRSKVHSARPLAIVPAMNVAL